MSCHMVKTNCASYLLHIKAAYYFWAGVFHSSFCCMYPPSGEKSINSVFSDYVHSILWWSNTDSVAINTVLFLSGLYGLSWDISHDGIWKRGLVNHFPLTGTIQIVNNPCCRC